MNSYINQDVMDNVFIVCTLVAGYVLFSIWSRKKGLESLAAWAGQKRLKIINAHRRFFLPNLQWGSGKYQQFFRVTVSDKEGMTREAWVRCSKLGFTEPQNVEVAWDDEGKQ